MNLTRDILLTVYITSMFLLGAEFCLRQADINFDASFYHLDRDLGYALRADVEGWNVKEHEVLVKVNSQGLRDVEHSFQRPPNVIRIAVVGDSVSEAKQVELNQAYWFVLQKELNQRLTGTKVSVEVVNFGVAGYGMAQEYGLIKDKIWQYDPQIVVLSTTLRAGILNSVRKLAIGTDQGPVPFYEMRDGKLELDELTNAQRAGYRDSNRMHDEFGNMINSVRLIALTNAAMRKAMAMVSALRHPSLPQAGNPEYYADTLPLLGPSTPELANAWSITTGLIEMSHQAAAEHHAEFWLFTLDEPAQVDPDAASREAFRRKLGVNDLFLSDKLLAEFAEKHGILHGVLAPLMLDYATKNQVILHGFHGTPRNVGHWNETGHRVAGELMAAQMMQGSALLRKN